jgi:hypothetical protein
MRHKRRCENADWRYTVGLAGVVIAAFHGGASLPPTKPTGVRIPGRVVRHGRCVVGRWRARRLRVKVPAAVREAGAHRIVAGDEGGRVLTSVSVPGRVVRRKRAGVEHWRAIRRTFNRDAPALRGVRR